MTNTPVIAREHSDRGNPRNNGRSGLYWQTCSNLRDCFTAFAMTYRPLPSLSGKHFFRFLLTL